MRNLTTGRGRFRTPVREIPQAGSRSAAALRGPRHGARVHHAAEMSRDIEPPLPLPWTIDTRDEALRIRCSAPEPAPDLTEHGWQLRLLEDDLRLMDFERPRAVVVGPAYVMRPWSDPRASDAYRAYVAAFEARPGFPGWPRERWFSWATGYQAFRPNLSRVVYEDEQPVAYVVTALERDALWIVQMGVVPAHRRRGLGQALLERARRGAVDAGAAGLMLSVNADNPEARALYDAFGFRFHTRRAVYERVSVG